MKAGCFAWSPSKEQAACIVSTRSGDVTRLAFAAGDQNGPRYAIATELDPTIARAANDLLAHDRYEPLAVPPQQLRVGDSVKVGNTELRFSSKPRTLPGGTNVTSFGLKAHCPHDESNVIAVNFERPTDQFRVAVRVLGQHALVEATTRMTDEHGIEHEEYGALVYNATLCAVRDDYSYPHAEDRD